MEIKSFLKLLIKKADTPKQIIWLNFRDELNGNVKNPKTVILNYGTESETINVIDKIKKRNELILVVPPDYFENLDYLNSRKELLKGNISDIYKDDQTIIIRWDLEEKSEIHLYSNPDDLVNKNALAVFLKVSKRSCYFYFSMHKYLFETRREEGLKHLLIKNKCYEITKRFLNLAEPSVLDEMPVPKIENTKVLLNTYDFKDYRKHGYKFLNRLKDIVMSSDKTELETNQIFDDGRTESVILDVKFHNFLDKNKEIIIKLLNKDLKDGEIQVRNIEKSRTRGWFDFYIVTNNDFVYYVNTKHGAYKGKSANSNANGGKSLGSYILSGSPYLGVKRKWPQILEGGFLDNEIFVDYFIFEIKKDEGKYREINVCSIFDLSSITVNNNQALVGLQYNIKNKEIDLDQTLQQIKNKFREWATDHLDKHRLIAEANARGLIKDGIKTTEEILTKMIMNMGNVNGEKISPEKATEMYLDWFNKKEQDE